MHSLTHNPLNYLPPVQRRLILSFGQLLHRYQDIERDMLTVAAAAGANAEAPVTPE